jgi:SAM-dependent methyltransferase
LARIPSSARTVLDIGCGTGRLGQALRARQAAKVMGVELDPRAAETARGRLDGVVCGDVEKMELEFAKGEFDAVVCGDILEHLRDAESLLRKVHDWLRPDGRLVASIPNVRHHSVVRGLLEGNWTYEGAGLLDQTHLRFFTRRSIEGMLRRTGYVPETIEGILGPGDERSAGGAARGTVSVGRFRLEGLPLEEAEAFFTYQYLVSARPAPSIADGASGSGRTTTVSGSNLGCVLAIRDRSPDSLERTLQTYIYQTIEPCDKVLFDYGSAKSVASAYRDLCQRYGWRYVACEVPVTEWCLGDAYNRAVGALAADVEVVFKNDTDVLLGADVLAMAAERGRDRLCLFSRFTTGEGVMYPARFTGHGDLAALMTAEPLPTAEDCERIQAFPRHWFEEIGGFDLAYRGWGYEDSDLRLRAEWSIGVVRVTTSLLVHQGHARGPFDPRTAQNRAYYESGKGRRCVIRNR